jgi:hypothetical protein
VTEAQRRSSRDGLDRLLATASAALLVVAVLAVALLS